MIAALAKYRHFGRAAEALGISQPGLHQGPPLCGARLGVKLFDRASPVQPTAFGEIVLARSSDIITGFAEIRREIDHAKRAGGDELTVNIGVPRRRDFGPAGDGEFSATFRMRCSISIKSWDEVLEDVAAGRCDLGFASITGARENAHLETTHLRSCRNGLSLPRRPSAERPFLDRLPGSDEIFLGRPSWRDHPAFPFGDETEGALSAGSTARPERSNRG